MSLTKDEAAEVKRLIANAGQAVWHEATLNVNIKSCWQCNKVLHTYIDSLTQPAPELTDGELGDAIFSAVASMPMNLAAYPSRLYVARAVIAADRSKRGTV